MAKITDLTAIEIKKMLKLGFIINQIYETLGVPTKYIIYHIKRGTTWDWLTII